MPRIGAAYTDEWRDYVTRQARWVDFDNDYKTLDLSYMESVIWAFKQLWDKGLAYEGYHVLPYCWRDETPLSNHELRMDDDVYQSRQDPAITVGFRIAGRRRWTVRYLLIWTTTPWTLPSNQAVAVTLTSSTCVRSREAACREQTAPSGATCWRRRDWPRTPASSAKSPRSSATYRGSELLGIALPAAVSVFHGRAEQFSGAAG